MDGIQVKELCVPPKESPCPRTVLLAPTSVGRRSRVHQRRSVHSPLQITVHTLCVVRHWHAIPDRLVSHYLDIERNFNTINGSHMKPVKQFLGVQPAPDNLYWQE